MLNSGYIDFVVNGPGERTFPALLDALENNKPTSSSTTSLQARDRIIKTPKDELYDPDELPPLPYAKLNSFYPIPRYLGKTYLRTKTIAYHSEHGLSLQVFILRRGTDIQCPLEGKVGATHLQRHQMPEGKLWRQRHRGFTTMNFFVSEKRTVEFARLIKKKI